MTAVTQELRVLHAIPSLDPATGGPSFTVPQLVGALAELPQLGVSLLSQAERGREIPPCHPAVDSCLVGAKSPSGLFFRRSMPRDLTAAILEPRASIVHSHGLWTPFSHAVSNIAYAHDIPFVIHPRGMLEQWALLQKAWKKRLALALYQRRDLQQAKVIFATAKMEYESIRQFGLRQPVAIIANGVVQSEVDRVQRTAQHPDRRVRTVLFLSRIHPKKGLVNLVEAWSHIPTSGWRLVIAGGDHGGHLKELTDRAGQLGVDSSIQFVGELSGSRKAQAYAAADLFVLPTFSENYGVVVAEALTYGVPVITTRGAPWSDLTLYGCGWWIDIGVEPLQQALAQAMSLTDSERQVLGEKGRAYVRRYDWKKIAQQTVEVYRWVLKTGPEPDTIVND